jgi:hypothetical protein
MKTLLITAFLITTITYASCGQSNLFINPNEGSTGSSAGPSSGGSAHIPSPEGPSSGGSAHIPSPDGSSPGRSPNPGEYDGGEITDRDPNGDSSFDPNETISFDREMTFSAHTPAGRSSTSKFLVNTEKGYMGMNKEMMEEFAGIELPDSEDFKVHYRVTSTNGKTYYFVEINGVKQVLNRLPQDNIDCDQTNMSVQKFRENFSPTGDRLNVSSQNYNSKEYSGISVDTGNPVKVYIAEQDNVHIDPHDNPKTVGIFGLGYIYHDNKTQMVTRIENDHGTAELERIVNTNISFQGSNYRKRENVLFEESNENADVIEDVFRKKQEYINSSPSGQADITAKEQEMLDLEREREHKRKEAMNKYLDDGAPAENNSNYALEGYDPKDEITLRKLECEKRVIEINKMLERMSTSNSTYSRLVSEKACQEQKILGYKNAEMEMIAIKERFADDPHEGNVEKMTYFFQHVVPNLYTRNCTSN